MRTDLNKRSAIFKLPALGNRMFQRETKKLENKKLLHISHQKFYSSFRNEISVTKSRKTNGSSVSSIFLSPTLNY